MPPPNCIKMGSFKRNREKISMGLTLFSLVIAVARATPFPEDEKRYQLPSLATWSDSKIYPESQMSPSGFGRASMYGHMDPYSYFSTNLGRASSSTPSMCQRMNLYCSGHTQASCQRYCKGIGFRGGECQGSCCVCGANHQEWAQTQQQQPSKPKKNAEVLEASESRLDYNPWNNYWLQNYYYSNKSNNNLIDALLYSQRGIKKPLPTLKEVKHEKFQPKRYSYNRTKKTRVCQTDGCKRAARTLSENLDGKNSSAPSACENFYTFACSAFLRNTKIPPDQSEVTPFTLLRNKVSNQLQTLFEEGTKPQDPRPFRLVKTFYKSCTNLRAIDSLGLKPAVTQALDLIGSWPVLNDDDYSSDLFSWSHYIAWMRELGFSHDIFLKITVEPDIKDVKRKVITLATPNFSLISKDTLAKGLSDSSVKSYYNYMVDAAVMFGAKRDHAIREMRKVLDLEIAVAKAFTQSSDQYSRGSTFYLPTTIDELSRKYASVPWQELIERVLPDTVKISGVEPLVVTAPYYMERLILQVLPNQDTKTIANYAVWKMLSSSMEYLGKDARGLWFNFVSKTTGQKRETDRRKYCTDLTSASFGNAVGAMYVRKYFPPHHKIEAEKVIRNIHAAFIELLDEQVWMDTHTKAKAREKALAMGINVGYPEEHLRDDGINALYRNYEDFDVNDFFGNVRKLVIATNNLAMGILGRDKNPLPWALHGKSATVNAFYLPTENSIQFPAAILQPPFFSPDRPHYLNYGSIGWIVGHETTHGYDDQGHQFDKSGNHANWWDPFTKEAFKSKTKCIIDQYSRFTVNGLNLNGVNTQGENIADNGGIKQAWRAYKRWLSRTLGKDGEEERLPGFEGYSGEQLFWVAAAGNWCGVFREERLRSDVLHGVHSPGEFRVRGSFTNLKDEWGPLYGCGKHKTIPSGVKNEVCEVW